MGINTATITFKEELISLINSSGLPICNVELVMASVLNAVREKVTQAVAEEQKAEVKRDE